MAGFLNKTKGTTDLAPQDISEKIVNVLHSAVMALPQIISALKSGSEREEPLTDEDVLKILDKLLKEGTVCSKEIRTQGCKWTARIYWLTPQQKLVSMSPAVSDRETLSTGKTNAACTTPKNSSTLQRRSSRSGSPSHQFVSPVLKRSCGDSSQEYMKTPKRSRCDGNDDKAMQIKFSGCESRGSCLDKSLQIATECQSEDTVRELLIKKKKLLKTIQDREDTLHKLNLVRIQRSKNDLKELQVLIDKWRNVSQDAADRLLSKIHLDPHPTMAQLLCSLQVDKQLIQYCDDNEGFY